MEVGYSCPVSYSLLVIISVSVHVQCVVIVGGAKYTDCTDDKKHAHSTSADNNSHIVCGIIRDKSVLLIGKTKRAQPRAAWRRNTKPIVRLVVVVLVVLAR